MTSRDIIRKVDAFFAAGAEPAWSSFVLERLFADVDDDEAVLRALCEVLEVRQVNLGNAREADEFFRPTTAAPEAAIDVPGSPAAPATAPTAPTP